MKKFFKWKGNVGLICMDKILIKAGRVIIGFIFYSCVGGFIFYLLELFGIDNVIIKIIIALLCYFLIYIPISSYLKAIIKK